MLLAIDRVPVRHRIRVRTTNLADRSFVEERWRTKVVGRFSDERSAMKLVFATMIRAADRWCRVSISDLERHQLVLLRADLGLDPEPATTGDRKKEDRRRALPHDHRTTHLQDAQDLTRLRSVIWRSSRSRPRVSQRIRCGTGTARRLRRQASVGRRSPFGHFSARRGDEDLRHPCK